MPRLRAYARLGKCYLSWLKPDRFSLKSTLAVQHVGEDLAEAAKKLGAEASTETLDEQMHTLHEKIDHLPAVRVAQTEPIAVYITNNPVAATIWSVIFAEIAAAGGFVLSLAPGLPVSVFVTGISFGIYLICRAIGLVRGAGVQTPTAQHQQQPRR